MLKCIYVLLPSSPSRYKVSSQNSWENGMVEAVMHCQAGGFTGTAICSPTYNLQRVNLATLA